MAKKTKKSNTALKQSIKEAESKKRDEILKTTEVTFINADEKSDNKITFEQWWMIAYKKVDMRPHVKEILKVDFQSRGLSLKETEEKYNEALRVFGYNI